MNTPVTDPNSPRTSALAGHVVAENFAGWSAEIRQEFADNAHNHLAFLTVEHKNERKQD
jgi:hypothetical protein